MFRLTHSTMLVEKHLLMERLQKKSFLLYFNLFGLLPRSNFVDALHILCFTVTANYIFTEWESCTPFEASGM